MMRALVAFALLAACGHRAPQRSTTTLVVHVSDGGMPVGARVLLFDAQGQPVHIGSLDLYGKRQGAAACQIAPQVVGSWDGLIVANGTAEVPIGHDACVPSPAIPYGRYHVWAWRGVEYERWEGDVDLSENRGKVELAIALERAWTPHGALAADMHVHAHASNDSTLPNPQRVVAQVAAGIQVIGLSDHNANGDLGDEIHQLGLDDVVASIASNELTSEGLHMGVYPVVVDRERPRGGAPPEADVVHATVQHVFDIAHAMPGHPIVQVNHPRFRYDALYDGTGWDGVRWPPPFPLAFDAVEVLAGYSAFNVPGDRRFDDSVRDFYTMTDHGHLIAPMGNSDTHDLNWVLDGTTRTYVFVDDPRTRPFDQDGFIRAIRARRVVATSGPWIDLEVAAKQGATPTVGPGQAIVPDHGSVWVDVTIAQARWVHVDRIRITIGAPDGPKLAKTIDVPPDVRSYRFTGAVEVGAADTWLAVTADGDTPLPLEQTGSYQKDRWNRPGVTPFAIASPVLIDGDGNGRWKRGDADLALH
ncbi:MAG TPA: CehA/McbA family metallohydrolase [Kofleriaceae bacterium]|nr:CehA/McbA family metallohydrolase [Kofleriaceae bacterium]